MGLGKTLKKAAKSVKKTIKNPGKRFGKAYGLINPIWGAGSSAIESGTGISPEQQLMIASGVGGTVGFLGRGGSNMGDPSSADDVARMSQNGNGGSGLSNLFSGFGTGLLTGGLNYLGGKEAREADLASVREQMDFQEYMSNTAHQREVSDLRAAGLNPALSANSGASTPAGASIDAENIMPDIAKTLGSAKELSAIDAGINKTNTESKLVNKQIEIAEENRKNSAFQNFLNSKEREFLDKHPNYIGFKKWMDVVGPAIGSARDAAVVYRSLKGFGLEKSIGKEPGVIRPKDIDQNKITYPFK